MLCNESSLKATNRLKLPRISLLYAIPCLTLFLSACGNDDAIGDLESKYPIEIESCVCRYLAFESDSYSGIQYDEMLTQCNETTRSGHPSLPADTVSNPPLDSLRCAEAVEDWKETISDERAQQASNRRIYEELTTTEVQASP